MVPLDAAPVARCGPAGSGGEGGLSSLIWEEEEESCLDLLERNSFFILTQFQHNLPTMTHNQPQERPSPKQ